MSKRLIDADALLEQWSEVYTDVETWHRCIEISTVKAQPTIDAVEVVRCQNCKYYYGEETYTNHRICKMWNEEVFANGYCYMGEQKEKDDE